MKLPNIKPNPSNPRTIKQEDFEKLKDKLRRNPNGLEANKIVHRDGIIIAGNQRFRALQELVKEEFEIKDSYFLDATDWTKEQVREYLITSNVSDGKWDWELLANEWDIAELSEWGVAIPEYMGGDADNEGDDIKEPSTFKIVATFNNQDDLEMALDDVKHTVEVNNGKIIVNNA